MPMKPHSCTNNRKIILTAIGVLALGRDPQETTLCPQRKRNYKKMGESMAGLARKTWPPSPATRETIAEDSYWKTLKRSSE